LHEQKKCLLEYWKGQERKDLPSQLDDYLIINEFGNGIWLSGQ
jgi:hypothetical protein